MTYSEALDWEAALDRELAQRGPAKDTEQALNDLDDVRRRLAELDDSRQRGPLP
ncbi:hypothetical protein [Mycobacterium sp. 1245111.1]|uniref:hypothetical protein n=1 Tax=Mycobacterium sp. 1245111.1 TaxID=1834073 RepID=UPI0012EA8805|nr:hypothetical protein [Mycobacterium sp. 1245111.1]